MRFEFISKLEVHLKTQNLDNKLYQLSNHVFFPEEIIECVFRLKIQNWFSLVI